MDKVIIAVVQEPLCVCVFTHMELYSRAYLGCAQSSLVPDKFRRHLSCDRSYLIINNTIMK